MDSIEQITADACETVDQFIFRHRAAAIPALIGACGEWAVRHGGADVVKGSLTRALQMVDDMDAEMKRRAN